MIHGHDDDISRMTMVSSFRHPLSWLNFFASLNTLGGRLQTDSSTSASRTGSFSFARFTSVHHWAMDNGKVEDDEEDDFAVDDEDDEDETDYEDDDDLFLDDDENDDLDLVEKDDHDDDDVDKDDLE